MKYQRNNSPKWVIASLIALLIPAGGILWLGGIILVEIVRAICEFLLWIIGT